MNKIRAWCKSYRRRKVWSLCSKMPKKHLRSCRHLVYPRLLRKFQRSRPFERPWNSNHSLENRIWWRTWWNRKKWNWKNSSRSTALRMRAASSPTSDQHEGQRWMHRTCNSAPTASNHYSKYNKISQFQTRAWVPNQEPICASVRISSAVAPSKTVTPEPTFFEEHSTTTPRHRYVRWRSPDVIQMVR